jgi:L-rhamnose mutarotase
VRVGLHTRLKPGMEERYEAAHRAVWPEIRDGIRGAGVSTWLIFRDGLDLFHFIECEDYDRAVAEFARDPVNQRWQAEMAPMMAVAHDLSGESDDRMRVIFEL